jgi:hypothetical protein
LVVEPDDSNLANKSSLKYHAALPVVASINTAISAPDELFFVGAAPAAGTAGPSAKASSARSSSCALW